MLSHDHEKQKQMKTEITFIKYYHQIIKNAPPFY